MADTVIENLITRLSFDFDDEKLKKFDKFLGTAVKGLTAIAAGAAAASTAMFLFTKKIAEANDQLGRLAQTIGVDVETLQELGFVAELNKGSIDSMNSSLANLARLTSEASRGVGAGVEVFGMLGLSVTDSNGKLKDTDALLLEIADSIARLGTQAERQEFAQRLGFGADLLLTLQQGSAAIKRQRAEARALGLVFDQNAALAAEGFADEMLRLTSIVKGISNAVATKLMKHFTPMIKLFVEWFKINKELIKQGLSVFLDRAITTFRIVANVVGRVVGIILSLVNALGGLKNTIIIVTGLLLTMNATAILMPILLLTAAAAILLVLEDIIKFAEGGDSVLGDLAKRFPTIGIAAALLLKILGKIKEGWTLIFTKGDEALEGMILLLKDVGKNITDFVLNPVNKAIGLINKLPGISVGTLGTAQPAFQPQVHRVTPSQGAGQNTTNNSTTNGPITLNINGGDTDKVKKVVTDVLTEQYSGAQSNLASQVEF